MYLRPSRTDSIQHLTAIQVLYRLTYSQLNLFSGIADWENGVIGAIWFDMMIQAIDQL